MTTTLKSILAPLIFAVAGIAPAPEAAASAYSWPTLTTVYEQPDVANQRIRYLLPRSTHIQGQMADIAGWVRISAPVNGWIRKSSLALSLPPPLPEPERPGTLPDGVRFLQDIVYGTGGGVRLKLNLAWPANAAGPLPCIVAIHGGGWYGGAKEAFDQAVWEFARHGYVAATVDYRLSGTARFPAAVNDVKCAVRFLRANAARYRINPNRIGAWGGSAGGHLAQMLGVVGPGEGMEGTGGWAGTSSRVRAVVSWSGPTVLWKLPDYDDPMLKPFLGGTREEIPDVYRRASPITHVDAADPPMLLLGGTADGLIPANQQIGMIWTMIAKGAPGRADLVVGGGHALNTNYVPYQIIPAAEQTLAWFDRYLKN